MTQARFELDKYTTRVLDVIKGKHGLKNRNEALNKLVKDSGSAYVEPPINEEYLRELDEEYNTHKRSHRNRKMDDKELDRHLGLDE
ncbi:MAG: hypothetical protein ACLFNK_00875 [Candidatus Woesearchaeota archaeon]